MYWGDQTVPSVYTARRFNHGANQIVEFSFDTVTKNEVTLLFLSSLPATRTIFRNMCVHVRCLGFAVQVSVTIDDKLIGVAFANLNPDKTYWPAVMIECTERHAELVSFSITSTLNAAAPSRQLSSPLCAAWRLLSAFSARAIAGSTLDRDVRCLSLPFPFRMIVSHM